MSRRERWDWREEHGWDRHDTRRPGRRRGRLRLLVAAVALAGLVAVAAAIVIDRRRDNAREAALAAAPPPPARVTFPEGLRREDMASVVEQTTDLTAADYLAATGPGAEGARRAGRTPPTSLEGFLFPATYEVATTTTVQDLVAAQLAAYDAAVGGVDMSFARSRNLTPYDVLIIASMVEREVAVPEERALVAGVMYNRLRQRMRLDIDATVQYAVGEWRPLTGADLQSDSPYNTRRFAGLPPGPIASPGLASIEAAARPRATDFLYYVAREDGTGRHYFARTLEEFEAQKARARRNAGG